MAIDIAYPEWFSDGTLMTLIMLTYIVAVIVFFMNRAKTNPPTIRPLPAVQALPELVGRATEMKKPVLYLIGAGGGEGAVFSYYAPQIIGSYTIMSYVCQQTARMGAPFIHVLLQPAAIPVAMSIVEEAYKAEGKMEDYKPTEMVRFVSPVQHSMAAYIMGLMVKEQIASNIMIGPFYSEALMYLETAQRVGAMQIAGTARTTQLPWMAVIADYMLIGEEMFAAGAYLSEDKSLLGTIQGQDWGRFVVLALIPIGFLALLGGSSIILDLLKI